MKRTALAAGFVAIGVLASAMPAQATDGVTELVRPGTHRKVGCYAGWSGNDASLLCEDAWATGIILLQSRVPGGAWGTHALYWRNGFFAGSVMQQSFSRPTLPGAEVRVKYVVRDADRRNGVVDGKAIVAWDV